MANEIFGYFFSIRFLLILLAMFLLLVNDFRVYKKDKKLDSRAQKVEADHAAMKKELTLISKTLAIATGEWQTIDLSQGVPPVVSDAAFLIFKSQGGTVKGYVKGAGYDEQYPFDTSINDSAPVALKIKEPKAQYIITFPNENKVNLSIFVAGYRIIR